MALQRGEALLDLLALRPDLERMPRHAGGIAVRVHRLELGRGAQQLAAGPLFVVGSEPVRGYLDPGRVSCLEALAESAVQVAPAKPGNVAVQRLRDSTRVYPSSEVIRASAKTLLIVAQGDER